MFYMVLVACIWTFSIFIYHTLRVDHTWNTYSKSDLTIDLYKFTKASLMKKLYFLLIIPKET